MDGNDAMKYICFLILCLFFMLHCLQKLALESEVREKEQELIRVRVRYNEAENELQRSKQQVLKLHQEQEKKAEQVKTHSLIPIV